MASTKCPSADAELKDCCTFYTPDIYTPRVPLTNLAPRDTSLECKLEMTLSSQAQTAAQGMSDRSLEEYLDTPNQAERRVAKYNFETTFNTYVMPTWQSMANR